jgi:alpha-D-ribose 1-methylphosphonate 5-triphosphate synthase subunit PhnH
MTVVHAIQALDSQAAFRAVMRACSRPGQIERVQPVPAPAALMPATAAFLRALSDYETPVWLDKGLAETPAVADWLGFETGAPITTDPSEAMFAVVCAPARMPALDRFALGTPDYPDRSTTMILQVSHFGGPVMSLAGPGVRGVRSFAAEPLPHDFPERLAANHALFPRGLDFIFSAGDRIAALPRSTRVTWGRG